MHISDIYTEYFNLMSKLLRKSKNQNQIVILFERSYDTIFVNVVILKVWISIKNLDEEQIEKQWIPF